MDVRMPVQEFAVRLNRRNHARDHVVGTQKPPDFRLDAGPGTVRQFAQQADVERCLTCKQRSEKHWEPPPEKKSCRVYCGNTDIVVASHRRIEPWDSMPTAMHSIEQIFKRPHRPLSNILAHQLLLREEIPYRLYSGDEQHEDASHVCRNSDTYNRCRDDEDD